MNLYETYQYVAYDLVDPRIKEEIFFYRPYIAFAILFSYWYFVRVWGPKFMKHREPYKIEWLINIYNGIQIIWNSIMASHNLYILIYSYLFGEIPFSIWCFPMMYTDEFYITRMMYLQSKIYVYNKFFDLSETIFFILRKKFKQVTYLHLYHHVVMCVGCWSGTRYGAGGNPSMMGIFNTAVHAAMYTYYQLSLMGYTKYLWWKKHLTQFQILQFVIIFVHASSVFYQSSCYYNPFCTWLTVAQALYFIYLFGCFYIQEYIVKKVKKT